MRVDSGKEPFASQDLPNGGQQLQSAGFLEETSGRSSVLGLLKLFGTRRKREDENLGGRTGLAGIRQVAVIP